MACQDNPIYFITNYLQIVTLDHGLQPFKLYEFQKEMVDKFHNNRFTICKLPRQTGKSTTIIAYLLHYAIFNQNVNIAILANKAAVARDLLGRLQLAYENLPKWLQQGVINWNKGNLELENGSKILAAATSSSAVRGGSYNVIFLDEFAYVPNNIAEQFFSSTEFDCEFLGSVDTLITPSKLRMLSHNTPRTSNAGLDIHEMPQKDKRYVITVDVARGTVNDYSAFVVIDATSIPYKVVAKYKNNEIKPLLFPQIIHKVYEQQRLQRK